MVGAQVPGHRAGVARSRRSSGPRSRSRTSGRPRRLDLGKCRGHARRIDPARQEDARAARRTAGAAPPPSRKLVPEPLGRFLEGARPLGRAGRRPSTATSVDRAVLPDQNVGRRQLLHPLPDRMRRRDVFIEEITGQALRGRAAAAISGCAQHGLRLRAETQAAAGQSPRSRAASGPSGRGRGPAGSAARPRSPARTSRSSAATKSAPCSS